MLKRCFDSCPLTFKIESMENIRSFRFECSRALNEVYCVYHSIWCAKFIAMDRQEDATVESSRLRSEVAQLRKRVADLEAQLLLKSSTLETRSNNVAGGTPEHTGSDQTSNEVPGKCFGWKGIDHTLNKNQVERYSRQILLRSFGVEGGFQSRTPAYFQY